MNFIKKIKNIKIIEKAIVNTNIYNNLPMNEIFLLSINKMICKISENIIVY